MVILLCAAAFGQGLSLPSGAMLLSVDQTEVAATSLAVSIDGTRVLVFGSERAVLVGPDGAPIATAERNGITHGDVAANGRFALVHEGGITIHGDGGREQLRLAAFGRVADIALSPDGRHLAVATTLALTVNDAVDGRTLWTSDGDARAVGYDAKGGLWADREGVVTQFNATNGRPIAAGPMPVPAGFLADGCLRAPVPELPGGEGALCPVGRAVGLTRGVDRLWLLEGEKLQRWTLLGQNEIAPYGVDGGAAIVGLAWLGSADLVVARLDGKVSRLGPDGSVQAEVAVPDCNGCTPLAIGGDPNGGFWAFGPTGAFQAWDAAGAPVGRVRATTLISARQLPDGRWVSLGTDGRARIGSSPGKGSATKPVPGARGVDAAGDTVAVWSDTGLWTYDTKGRNRAAPSLGAGRKPVAVELSADGTGVAVVDDGGALHLYATADGKSVFRNSAGLVGTALAWSPDGETIYAGGSPLRMFASADGTESGRLVLAPDGPIELVSVAGDGTLAVVHTGPATQILRRVSHLPSVPMVVASPSAPTE